MSKPIIAVIGDHQCDSQTQQLAEEVGACIASKGALLICGGYGGVMEAAARGAKSRGGQTIGVLSGKEPGEANRWIDIPIVTGLGDARNVIIARSAHGAIAVGGHFGTLSEIAFLLKFNTPLVGLGSWKLGHHDEKKAADFPNAKTAHEALSLLYQHIKV